MDVVSAQASGGDGAFIDRLNAKLPRDVAESFNDAQYEAIECAFGARRWRNHAVDLRWLLPLFGRNYYFVLLAGGERRSRQRQLRDRILHPLVSFGNGLVAAVFFTAIMLSGLVTLYLVKSLVGINLMPDHSLGIMPAILQELKMLFG